MKIRLFWFGLTILLLTGGTILLASGYLGRAEQLFNLILAWLLVTLGVRLFSRVEPETKPVEKNNVWTWLVVVSLLIFVFSPFILRPFINLGNDSNFLSPSLLKSLPLFPQAWESELGGVDLGHNQVVNMWMQPLWVFISILGRLGLTYLQLTKGLMVAQIIVGSLGIYFLFKKLGFASWTIPVGAIFYFFNTYFLVNIDGGLIFLSFAYACFPMGVYWALNLSENNSTKNWIVASLWTLLISFFDIRVVPLLLSIAIIWTVIIKKYRGIFALVSVGLFLVAAHLFWILPALKTGVSLPVSYAVNGGGEQFSLFSSGHLLFMSQPHWYSNIFGSIQTPRWYFIGIPFLVILALGFAKATPKYKLLTGLTLMGLFLVKGSNFPGGQLYLWLYKNFPGFVFFRDPSKFGPLLILGYTGFICLALEAIGQKLPKLKPLLFIGVGVYLVSLIYPIFMSKTTGAFVATPQVASYEQFSKVISNPNEFSRVLWLPTKPPWGIVDLSPIWTEAGWLLGKRPFLSAIDGTYEYYNYVRATESASLFDVTGIKYLLYPISDQRKRELKPDEREYYEWQEKWFDSQSWLEDMSPFSGLAAYKTTTVSGKFYQPQNWLWVVGPDDTYAQLSKLSNLRLANIGITHLNNFSLNILDWIKQGQYLYFNKVGFLDLVMTQVEKKNLISLYSFVSPTADGRVQWWGRNFGNFLFIKNFLKDHYGINNNDYDLEKGYVIAEGEKTLKIEHSFPQGRLFVRVLESQKGDKLEFTINGKPTTVTTVSDTDVLVWKDLGEYPEISKIEIKSHGSINVVNALAIIPEQEYRQLISYAQLVVSKSKVITDLKNLAVIAHSPSTVRYSKLSQTEYSIDIPAAPTWVVFSESYDPRWQISASPSSPVPAYDMLNAFWVDKPGSYRIFYTPQIWVWRGLQISFGLVAVLAVGLFWRYRYGKN